MYQQYLADPSSVDQAWHEFFADYRPGSPVSASDDRGAPATAPQEESAPAPAEQPAPARQQAPDQQPTAGAGAPSRATRVQERTEDTVVNRAADRTAQQQPAAKAVPDAKPAPAAKPAPKAAPPTGDGPRRVPLRGAAASVVKNMNASLTVPTATSVRAVPAKLLVDNRIVVNNHLARSRGGKVSFTHIIGFALVKALGVMPEMNNGFGHDEKGKPVLVTPAHVNLGLAIDLAKPDGTRQLLVPSIKAAETMDFAHFWTAYEDVVRKARDNKLTVADFQGTTISLTNPGGIGTVHSVPRLMAGQGAIIGVGAMEYSPEWQGASEEAINRNAISKAMTLTSTYDHRVIQGAQSGEFLKRVHSLLIGDDGFYDEIFRSLRIPYEPIRWARDVVANHDDDIVKQARILEL